jgi:hypothetical protein
VEASNRLYLAEHMPFMLVWGAHDTIIPPAHGRAAHKRLPGSRLEIFERSGHFPQLDEPERFIDVISEFMQSTEPSAMDAAEWRELLTKRPPRRRARAAEPAPARL